MNTPLHRHDWIPTGRRAVHAYGRPVIYVRCTYCGQIGFRFDGSRVVYTWEQE